MNSRGLFMKTYTNRRCDQGFSLAQVLVTMVILGVLSIAVGLTVFSLVGDSRNTVLAANVQTAATAVQTTLALNPPLAQFEDVNSDGTPDGEDAGLVVAAGELPQALMDALVEAAPLNWVTGGTAADWALAANDGPDTVRVQMLRSAAPAAATAATAPAAPWLIDDGAAIRLHARNSDDSWACALIVMRPRTSAQVGAAAAVTYPAVTAADVGRLRGIWYDSGPFADPDATANSTGLHHCSPTFVTAGQVIPPGAGVTGRAVLPSSATEWDIPLDKLATTAAPANDASGEKNMRRSVPAFE